MQKSVVLLGKIGSGKTTLFNKITRSKEKTQYGGESTTRSVFMKQSAYGKGFKVLDTPGFGSNLEKIVHMAGVLSALSQGPLNRIFILIQSKRTDLMMEDLKEMYPAFKKFTVLVTVIVTFWDLCPAAEAAKNEADFQARLKKLKINSTLFIGNNDSADKICQEMDRLLDQSVAENVKLSDEEIFENFNMQEYDQDLIFNLELEQEELQKDYRIFSNQAKTMIEKQNFDQAVLPEFLYALTDFASNQVESYVKKFEDDNKDLIDELKDQNQVKAFLIHFLLKKSLFKEYQSIVDKANGKQSAVTSYLMRYIKKCNFCGEVWIKVSGCSGPTICGRILDKNHPDDLLKGQTPKKFQIKYEEKKLTITQQELSQVNAQMVSNNLQVKENLLLSRKEVSLSGEKFQVGQLGCSRKINWGEMLNLTEKEMKQLVEVMDQTLLKQIKDQENELRLKGEAEKTLYGDELRKQIQEQQKKTKIVD